MNQTVTAIACIAAAAAVAGAAGAWVAYALVWRLLRQFMAGPPSAAADMADALRARHSLGDGGAERSTLRSSQSEAGRSGERRRRSF